VRKGTFRVWKDRVREGDREVGREGFFITTYASPAMAFVTTIALGSDSSVRNLSTNPNFSAACREGKVMVDQCTHTTTHTYTRGTQQRDRDRDREKERQRDRERQTEEREEREKEREKNRQMERETADLRTQSIHLGGANRRCFTDCTFA